MKNSTKRQSGRGALLSMSGSGPQQPKNSFALSIRIIERYNAKVKTPALSYTHTTIVFNLAHSVVIIENAFNKIIFHMEIFRIEWYSEFMSREHCSSLSLPLSSCSLSPGTYVSSSPVCRIGLFPHTYFTLSILEAHFSPYIFFCW